jgi:hypothetical protein
VNSTAPSPRTHGALAAIFWGGLICGALDITAAFIVYGAFGARPIPILQGIAAGVLGARSFDGGLPTAALGLFFQFFIAFSVATVYYAASRVLPFLVSHSLICGALYGIAVYFFMNRIVVPLSAAHKFPFSLRGMLIGVTIHIFCVGLPVAIVTRRFSAV